MLPPATSYASPGASATDATAPPAPRFPTTIRVEKLMSPKISPPYPLNQVLKVRIMDGFMQLSCQRLNLGGCVCRVPASPRSGPRHFHATSRYRLVRCSSPPLPPRKHPQGHAAGQVGDMLEGLLVATARVVGDGEVGEAAAGSISRAASRAGGRR